MNCNPILANIGFGTLIFGSAFAIWGLLAFVRFLSGLPRRLDLLESGQEHAEVLLQSHRNEINALNTKTVNLCADNRSPGHLAGQVSHIFAELDSLKRSVDSLTERRYWEEKAQVAEARIKEEAKRKKQ